ncbi:hypothetical protein HLRTI_002784 [Halorhabdus tiamatea SARL4B]|uniref:Uncharacterized protein n=1 Tax=Halorhabdus tiamatea SARL4B TaxID=1033806 RepID=F7PIA3_9EURY|nr:DUF5788 family protein [Halorhabdus tiamatea]ERJ05206.1 hypothetical protein HLRTI_002784 [Halorhabdus tiamatea SARL4B]CCQ34889.1 conserved hypothetical protein [Halorhabdus tiamatea SARL4B]
MDDTRDDEPLSDRRREELLERVQRKSATVGQQLPQAVEIQGTEMNLKEFVWETKRQGTVPPELRDRVRKVRAKLTAERKERKQRLESADLTAKEAEDLAQSIVGIDRAISALKNLHEPNLADSARQADVESSRRWVSFLDSILD